MLTDTVSGPPDEANQNTSVGLRIQLAAARRICTHRAWPACLLAGNSKAALVSSTRRICGQGGKGHVAPGPVLSASTPSYSVLVPW
jgi:hypothetical protein